MKHNRGIARETRGGGNGVICASSGNAAGAAATSVAGTARRLGHIRAAEVINPDDLAPVDVEAREGRRAGARGRPGGIVREPLPER